MSQFIQKKHLKWDEMQTRSYLHWEWQEYLEIRYLPTEFRTKRHRKRLNRFWRNKINKAMTQLNVRLSRICKFVAINSNSEPGTKCSKFIFRESVKQNLTVDKTKFSFFCVKRQQQLKWLTIFFPHTSLLFSGDEHEIIQFFPCNFSHIVIPSSFSHSLTEYNRSKNIINADHHIKLRTYGTLLREKKLTLVLVCARVPTHALWLFCNSKCRWLLNRTHSLTQFNRSLSAVRTALFPNLFSLSTESNVVVSYNCHYHLGW